MYPAGWLQALERCQQALTLLEELGDLRGQAGTWDSVGYAQHHFDDYDAALVSYDRALKLYREVGESIALIHLGDTHTAAGNPTAAAEAWRAALVILDQLDDPEAAQARTRLQAG
jgi:tetratricopeptide (TPR) repeat protein